MSNELSIIKRENVELIASTAPQAFQENQVSRERCLDAGKSLLANIHAHGMSDELDQQASIFIEKARKTVKKMYDKRSPLTKFFDEIRTTFTGMESDVDPTKKNSIPYQLQQLRNEYAAKKRAEEEERRRAALVEQQKQASITKYRTDLEEDYKKTLTYSINVGLNNLMGINASITLDNYEENKKKIESFSEVLDETLFARSTVMLPTNVSSDELAKWREQVLNQLIGNFRTRYSDEIGRAKQEYITMLPSKKMELERAAKASAEEAERIKREIELREAAESARKEAERQERERKEADASELAKKQAEMESLFGESKYGIQTYQPKTVVKKKINLLNPEGIMPIISMWWLEEGCHLPVDELAKMFKKQITYCEKVANDASEPRLINDESVEYVEAVKAK